jgi:hypothetical protein
MTFTQLLPWRVAAVSLGVAVGAAVGCGGATSTVVVTAPAAAPKTSTVVVHEQSTKQAHPRKWKNCDANVRAKIGTTSCAFAENVFYSYWKARQAGDDSFKVYSPVTRRAYTMTCTAGVKVACRAGDGGAVRFPQTAVDAYSADQGVAYCSSHQLGASGGGCSGPATDSTQAVPALPATDQPGGGSDCDPSYEGACLDPDASDYDCEGGSGDGPQYTGGVTVVGDDHFGLDRDGDGIACES